VIFHASHCPRHLYMYKQLRVDHIETVCEHARFAGCWPFVISAVSAECLRAHHHAVPIGDDAAVWAGAGDDELPRGPAGHPRDWLHTSCVKPAKPPPKLQIVALLSIFTILHAFFSKRHRKTLYVTESCALDCTSHQSAAA
jgi:hypothetical protein